MTRDEFTDTVASMTPRQKEAMAMFGASVGVSAVVADHINASTDWILETRFDQQLRSTEVRMLAKLFLNAVYPNATPERD